ncbi:hypothetical protein TSO5_04845 [Azospirillum sp. TSO5]|nr:hypothetical protein TSO5_04845 [Azospirillum sp. TSO5]
MERSGPVFLDAMVLSLGCVQRRDFVQFLGKFPAIAIEVVTGLQVQPQFRTVSAELAETQCHGWGHRGLFREDAVEHLT